MAKVNRPAAASLPVEPPTARVGERSFEHNGQTWMYNPDLITMEQAVIADEALQFKLELSQRELPSFSVAMDAGATEWFAKCAGALIVRVEGGVTIPASPAQWSAAVKFINSLPYSMMPQVKECLEDFFTSIGRDKAISYVLNERSKRTSNAVVSALVKTLTQGRQASS